jgi:hypothetical protein
MKPTIESRYVIEEEMKDIETERQARVLLKDGLKASFVHYRDFLAGDSLLEPADEHLLYLRDLLKKFLIRCPVY